MRNGGNPLEAFQFLTSLLQMLRSSRDLEVEVLGQPLGADLYVGFQNAGKSRRGAGALTSHSGSRSEGRRLLRRA